MINKTQNSPSVFPEFYEELQRVVENKFENQNYMSWYSPPALFTFLSAWVFLMTIGIKSAKTSSKFVVNSANCSYTILPIELHEHPGYAYNLFVKSVNYPLHPNNDHIIIDNINGWILNKMATNYDCSKYFMQYIDSLLSYKFVDGNSHYWKLEELTDFTNEKSPFYIPQSKINAIKTSSIKRKQALFYKPCYLSISNAINGVSLVNIMESMLTPNKKHALATKVIEKMPGLCDAILNLGLELGMLHNDLHFGNILFDIPSEDLVCIDYGRMHFQKFVDEGSLTNKPLHAFVYREAFKHDLVDEDIQPTYELVMKKYHKYMKSTILKDSKYPMCIADFITLTMNMYIFFLVTQQECLNNTPDLLHKLNLVVYIKHTNLEDLLKRNVIIFIPATISDIITFGNSLIEFLNGRTHNLSKQETNYLKLMAEGMIYFAIAVSLNNESRKQTLSLGHISDEFIIVPLNDYNCVPFYSHFQFVGDLSQIEKILDVLVANQKKLENLTFVSKFTQTSSISYTPVSPFNSLQSSTNSSTGGRRKKGSKQRGGGTFSDEEDKSFSIFTKLKETNIENDSLSEQMMDNLTANVYANDKYKVSPSPIIQDKSKEIQVKTNAVSTEMNYLVDIRLRSKSNGTETVNATSKLLSTRQNNIVLSNAMKNALHNLPTTAGVAGGKPKRKYIRKNPKNIKKK